MYLTIHGYRESIGSPKPIYDLAELARAAQLHDHVVLGDETIQIDRIYPEDGSGRSWNVVGRDRNDVQVERWVYALQTGKYGVIQPLS